MSLQGKCFGMFSFDAKECRHCLVKKQCKNTTINNGLKELMGYNLASKGSPPENFNKKNRI